MIDSLRHRLMDDAIPRVFGLDPLRPSRRSAQDGREHGSVPMALLLLSILQVASLLLSRQAAIETVIGHLPASLTQTDRAWVRQTLDQGAMVECAMAPLIMLPGLGLFALLLHVLGRLVPAPARPRFVQLFGLAVKVALIPAAGEVVSAAAGWRTPDGFPLGPPGLAWLGGGSGDFTLFALLRMMNVLTLWYFFALGAGLRALYRCTVLCSSLFAAAAWSFSMLGNLWLLRLIRDLLHLAL